MLVVKLVLVFHQDLLHRSLRRWLYNRLYLKPTVAQEDIVVSVDGVMQEV